MSSLVVDLADSVARKINSKRSPYSVNICKKPWSTEEDDRLRACILIHGTKNWSAVAGAMSERTGKQCRERWHNHLTPQINKGAWTEEEDRIILTMQEQLGNQWAKITRMLPGRSDNAVKNRFHMAMRARNREYKEQCSGHGGLGLGIPANSNIKIEPQRREPIGSPILLPLPDIYGQQVPCFQSFPSPPPVCSPGVDEYDEGDCDVDDHGLGLGCESNRLHLARIDPITNIPYADVQVFPTYLPATSQSNQRQQVQQQHQAQGFTSAYYPEAHVVTANSQDSLMIAGLNTSNQLFEPCASPLAYEFHVSNDANVTQSPALFADQMEECDGVDDGGFLEESGAMTGEYDGRDNNCLEIGMFMLEDTEMMMEWAQSEDAAEQDASCADQCLRVPLNWCAGQAHSEQDAEPAPSALCGINLWGRSMQQQYQQQGFSFPSQHHYPQHPQTELQLLAPAPKKAAASSWRLRW